MPRPYETAIMSEDTADDKMRQKREVNRLELASIVLYMNESACTSCLTEPKILEVRSFPGTRVCPAQDYSIVRENIISQTIYT
jgi:hypothetical protein